MRRRMIAVWIGLMLLFVSGCGQPSAGEQGNPSAAAAPEGTTAPEEPAYTFPSGPEEGELVVCFSHWYRTINELCRDAGYVIVGRVFIQEFSSDPMSYSSYAQVWVDEVLSGDMQPDQMITVSELGAQHADGNTATTDGVPLLREGERVLLFLQGPWENSGPCKISYSLVGDYQGKFFYHQEEDCWYAANLLGNGGIFVLSDASRPLSDEEMRQKLKNLYWRGSTGSGG